MSLEYVHGISARDLKQFLINRQKFIGPYIMEFILSIRDVLLNFLIDNAGNFYGEFISVSLKGIDYTFGKVHYTIRSQLNGIHSFQKRVYNLNSMCMMC